MRILHIANNLIEQKSGGGQVTRRNNSILKQIFGEENVDYIYLEREEIKNRILSKILTIFYNILGFCGGRTPKNQKKVMAEIMKNRYEYVFMDTSLFGNLIKKIKKVNKNLKIITFFHNIEYDYFFEMTRSYGKQFLPLVYSSKINEKNSTRYSDYLITLNKEESKRLKTLYGVNSTTEMPITFKNTVIQDNIKLKRNQQKYGVFVGSYFYGNINGIKWFDENVAGNIVCDILVIGNGMEKLNGVLKNKNLKIVGSVEDIAKYYLDCDFVIAPIFDGAGMKVKIAEAMMYGKTIIGTVEAFQGYDIEYDKIGKVCNSNIEFITAINKLVNENKTVYNDYSRNCFLSKYSDDSAEQKLKNMLNIGE